MLHMHGYKLKSFEIGTNSGLEKRFQIQKYITKVSIRIRVLLIQKIKPITI